jgi:predicted transcriptional regulator with HTH domain
VNELAFKILALLIRTHPDCLSVFHIAEILKVRQLKVRHFIHINPEGQEALNQLLALGLIEEVYNSRGLCYQIKIQDNINRTVYLVEDQHMGNIQYAHFTKERAELSLGAVRTLRCAGYTGLAINEIEVEQ